MKLYLSVLLAVCVARRALGDDQSIAAQERLADSPSNTAGKVATKTLEPPLQSSMEDASIEVANGAPPRARNPASRGLESKEQCRKRVNPPCRKACLKGRESERLDCLARCARRQSCICGSCSARKRKQARNRCARSCLCGCASERSKKNRIRCINNCSIRAKKVVTRNFINCKTCPNGYFDGCNNCVCIGNAGVKGFCTKVKCSQYLPASCNN